MKLLTTQPLPENRTYPGNFTDLTMSCHLDKMRLNRDTDAYFVRSGLLHNVTIQQQLVFFPTRIWQGSSNWTRYV